MIKVYTTKTCVYCHALMNWLDSEGVDYEEIDAADMDDIQTVPVTRFSKKGHEDLEIVGFDRPAIKKALKEFAE